MQEKKISNYTLGVASIIAIVFIVFFAINAHERRANIQNSDLQNSDTQANILNADTQQDALVGQAMGIINDIPSAANAKLCKLIIGSTTLYSDSLAVTLEEKGTAQFLGDTIAVEQINAEGCQVSVNGVSEYLAVGQIQRVGSVYITIKEAISN